MIEDYFGRRKLSTMLKIHNVYIDNLILSGDRVLEEYFQKTLNDYI
jgi:hypothetical protein